MGFWKAEEFQKFGYPISKVGLGGLLPDEHQEAWECLACIAEFLYCQGRDGWTVHSAAIFQEIVLRYKILVKESQGLNAHHVVNHNMTHIFEDVLNFSSPDNCWCFNFGCAVKSYISISRNRKSTEITFVRVELCREVLKVHSSLKSQGDSETAIYYPKETNYQFLQALESDMQHFTTEVSYLAATCDASQINSICAHLTAYLGANHGCISELAEECRSTFSLIQRKVVECYTD